MDCEAYRQKYIEREGRRNREVKRHTEGCGTEETDRSVPVATVNPSLGKPAGTVGPLQQPTY